MRLSAIARHAATRRFTAGEGGFNTGFDRLNVAGMPPTVFSCLTSAFTLHTTWLPDDRDAIHDGGSAQVASDSLIFHEGDGALCRADPGDWLLLLRLRDGSVSLIAGPSEGVAISALIRRFGLPTPTAHFSAVTLTGAHDATLDFPGRLIFAEAGLIFA